MRADGIFIAVEVDDGAAADAELARKLTEACPVDIFAQRESGTLELVEGNLDAGWRCEDRQALRRRGRPGLAASGARAGLAHSRPRSTPPARPRQAL